MLAGGRRGGVRERRGLKRRRDHGHRQLPRPGPNARRTPRRRGSGDESDPRPAPLQPARDLPGARRQEGRADRHRARAFSRLDGLGGRVGDRTGLQSDVLLASEGGRRMDAGRPRRGHPPLLGRARHRLPQDRRGLRTPPEDALRDQRLDSRRHEGPDHRPQGAPGNTPQVAGRGLRRPDRPGLQPRRRREQTLRHRLGNLRGRLARVLPGLRRLEEEAALPRRRALPSHRVDRRQDSPRSCCFSTKSCCTSAAASAGTATTW